MQKVYGQPVMVKPEKLDDWRALPELAMGRHEIFNMGAVIAAVDQARRAKVDGLPKEIAGEDGYVVPLPWVEVSQRRIYRLPLKFGSIVRKIFDDAMELGRAGGSNPLPRFYTFEKLQDGRVKVVADGSVREISTDVQ
jgi:hypothetical protein